MATEREMAELLGRRLGIDFGTSTRHLDGWGRADRCVEVREDLWLLLEIEGKQHHPSTNVLKLWPFLEGRRKLSVVLIHAFEKTGKNLRSTRGRLAEWLAQEMKRLLRQRFTYYRVIVDVTSGEVENATALVRSLDKVTKTRTSRRQRRA